MSSHRVPAAIPASGTPAASSYIQPQMRHIQVFIAASVAIMSSKRKPALGTTLGSTSKHELDG
jgi:hypothetical protein